MFGGMPLCFGIVCFDGGLGIGGGVGAYFSTGICLFSLRGTIWIEPWAGAQGFMYVSASIGPFEGGLKMIVTVLETAIPTFATTTFTEWPLDICTGSDLKTTPLSATLEVYIAIKICLWKCFRMTIVSIVVWSWSTGQQTKELWRNCKDQPDPSKPDFGQPQYLPSNSKIYTPLSQLVSESTPVKNCRVFDWEKKCNEGTGKVNWPKSAGSPPFFQVKQSCWIGGKRCEDVRNAEYVASRHTLHAPC
jgi:hypothetical protein